jgi:SAM-dependent methyltransferase
VEFREADAEALPFADASFDVALSTFGIMFTPNHAQSASEMMRVLRPGGRAGMANWTPEGFIGQLFKTIGKHVPPPAGVKSPGLWGTEDHLQQLFGERAARIGAQRKIFNFRYESAAHWLQIFRDFYGPVHKTFGALDDAGKQALEGDLLALLERSNTAGAASLVVPAEYLEVVITKRGA